MVCFTLVDQILASLQALFLCESPPHQSTFPRPLKYKAEVLLGYYIHTYTHIYIHIYIYMRFYVKAYQTSNVVVVEATYFLGTLKGLVYGNWSIWPHMIDYEGLPLVEFSKITKKCAHKVNRGEEVWTTLKVHKPVCHGISCVAFVANQKMEYFGRIFPPSSVLFH